jgi:hypothetical protein
MCVYVCVCVFVYRKLDTQSTTYYVYREEVMDYAIYELVDALDASVDDVDTFYTVLLIYVHI